MESKKIFFIVNHAAFFVSHRLELAIKAKELGWDVFLCIGKSGSDEMELPALEKLERHGIKFERFSFSPSGVNPFCEIWGFICILYSLIKNKPDIVHTASPKGMIYGGLSSRFARVKSLVIAVSGMGYLYTGNLTGVKKVIFKFVNNALKYVVNHPNKKIIVQNEDDYSFFLQEMAVKSVDLALIPGSGVDLSKFINIGLQKNNSVILPARLMADKGVFEFVEAARILLKKGIKWKFILVGSAAYDNPSSIGYEKVEKWVNEGIIEWYGHVDDMVPIYQACEIVCLPSYREGMPKVLLEAAASGKPVVTTDVVGCREAIISDVTGLIVPVKNAHSLSVALEKLINNDDLRLKFGSNGRKFAQSRFSIETVIESTFDLYSDLEK